MGCEKERKFSRGMVERFVGVLAKDMHSRRHSKSSRLLHQCEDRVPDGSFRRVNANERTRLYVAKAREDKGPGRRSSATTIRREMTVVIRPPNNTERGILPTERSLDRKPTRVLQPTNATSTRTATSCFKGISKGAEARSYRERAGSVELYET